jgi:glycosyltransferase involved in cell wall biosynthesis
MSLTMVVPFFNESKRWRPEYWTAATSLKGIEWIFVNDGSDDNTKEILDAFSLSRLNVRAIHLAPNNGKGEAVRAGMLNAICRSKPDLAGIGFIDGDGAFDLGDINRVVQIFYSKIRENADFDAIWTARVHLAGRNINRSIFRHYVGRVIATVVSARLEDSPYDTQSGFKIFAASSELKNCLAHPFLTRWLFDIEILLRWRMQTLRSMKVWEEPLLGWSDVAGSKVTLLQSVKIIREIYLINKLKRMSHQPRTAS